MPDGQTPIDNAILADFVVTLYDDLDALVSLREVLFLPPYTDQYTVEAVRALGESWPGVLNERISRVQEVIQLGPSTLPDENGLSGAELRLKIAVWQRARAAAVAEFENSEDREARSAELPPINRPYYGGGLSFPRKLPRRVRRGLKWVGKMLGYADTIIGSLVKIAGQFERLKELKETIEKLSGDVADEYPEAD